MRIDVTAGGIHRDAVARPRARDSRGDEAMQRQAGYLCDSIPNRHVQGSDGDAPLPVPTGFFAAQHDVPRAKRIKIAPGLVNQLLFLGRE